VDLDQEGLSSRLGRWSGLALAVVGLLVSLITLVEVEAFSQHRLVYHFLWWSVTSPMGYPGTAAWPFGHCLTTGGSNYGYPGNRCLFPNFDETILLFALVMASGLFVRGYFDRTSKGLRPRVRATRALVASAHLMALYVALVLAWCIVLFGALPTWDQSVLWAASAGGSYPDGTWNLFTNTCLIHDPTYSPVWPSCDFPNFYEGLVTAVSTVVATYTLKVRYGGVTSVELD